MTPRATWTPASMPTAKDAQVRRVQEIIRETVPDAICKLILDGETVICSSAGFEVRFDLAAPSYAELGRNARRLKDMIDEAWAAAVLGRAARVVE